MKQKLFKQTKPDSSKEDNDLKFATTKKRFSFSIDGKKFSKRFTIIFLATVAISGLLIGFLMALNSFFNQYYFEFRSPIIIQEPILLHEREQALLSPIPEELNLQVQAQEPTPTPKPDYRSMVKEKTVNCIDAHPELVDPLTEAFSDEPTAILDLVCRESGYRSDAVNPTSGACGLFQAYPCDKLKCDFDDIDCQIEWGKKYINDRYGSVEAALLHHDQKGWY